MTAIEVVAALEKALEAGPEPIATDLYGDRYFMGDYSSAQLSSAQDKFFTACSPLAIRTLLDAHAEQSKIIAELLDQMHHFANADQRLWDEGQRDPESFKSWVRSRAAHLLAKFTDRAALDDNTKGAQP